MLNFDRYVMRYGEYGVQAIIEWLERREGIRASIEASLEERWNGLMHMPVHPMPLAA